MTEHVGLGEKVARCLINWEAHLYICPECMKDEIYGRKYNLEQWMEKYDIPERYLDQMWEESEKIVRHIVAAQVAQRLQGKAKPKQSYPGS